MLSERHLAEVAPVLPRWMAFSAVGLLGIVVHLSLLLLLTGGLEVHYMVATALAVEATVLHNFLWHERWTWLDRTCMAPTRSWARLLRFNLATGCVSMTGNLILMRLYVGALQFPTLVAAICSIGSCWLLNFVAADRLVFTQVGCDTDRRACPGRRSSYLR